MSATRDLYKLLNVSRTTTQPEIKAAYRKLALKLHPDTTGNDKRLTEEFNKVKDAYEILSDDVTRRNYDTSLGPRHHNNNSNGNFNANDSSRYNHESSSQPQSWQAAYQTAYSRQSYSSSSTDENNHDEAMMNDH